jgi:integrase
MGKRNRLEVVPGYVDKDGEIIWAIHGTVNGKRIRRSAHTSDRKEAERVAREIEAKAILNKPVSNAPGERTFAFVAGEYLKRGGRDGNGGDGTYLAKIIKHFGPDRRMSTITGGDIRDMAVDLYPHASGGTRNRQAIGPAITVFNYGAERGWCHPVKVKRFPEPKVTRKTVDREWIDRFMAHCEHPGVRAMQLVIFTTGARRSDCYRMHRKNFSYSDRTITVETSKNGDPHTFQLTKEAADALQALPYIGPNIFGVRHKDEIYPIIRATCKKAGIPYVPPHQSGRHSFASYMITERGVDPSTVGNLANWKSIHVLLSRYVHSKRHREAVEMMEPESAVTSKSKRKIRRLK